MTTLDSTASRLPWNPVDPFPFYADLRRHGDVVWDATARSWLVLGYHSARQVLGGPRWTHDPLNSPYAPAVRDIVSPELFRKSMLVNGGATHQRLRGATRDVFTTAFITGLEPGITAIAETVIGSLPTGEVIDFVSQVALPLPLAVIGEWLGIDADTSRLLGSHAPAVISMLLPLATTEEITAGAAASAALVAHFLPLLASRRTRPGEDLLSFIASDPNLSLEEAVMTAVHIGIAGFETVASLLGSAIVRLLTPGPDGTRLIDGLDLCDPPVITELTRLDGPAQAIPRTAMAPQRIGEIHIATDEQVVVVLAAANRDPTVFDEPDQLRPGREGPAPLTFGHGPHHCLGAALARLEFEVALHQTLARDPVLSGPITWRTTPAVRGPVTLPMVFRRASNGSP